MLIRAVPAAMAVATSVVIRPPPLWISELAVYVAYSVSPCIRLVAVIAAVTLFVTAGWQRWARHHGTANQDPEGLNADGLAR